MKTMCIYALVFVFLLTGKIACGAPFLVCDPYPTKGPQPAKFRITINGKVYESSLMRNPNGSVYLRYDIGNLPDGTYTASAIAVDSEGAESLPATCSFKKIGSEAEPYTPPVPKEKIRPSQSFQGHIRLEGRHSP